MIRSIHIKLLLLISLSILFGHFALGQVDQHICVGATGTYTAGGGNASIMNWYLNVVDDTPDFSEDLSTKTESTEYPGYYLSTYSIVWTNSNIGDHVISMVEDNGNCESATVSRTIRVHAVPVISEPITQTSIPACSGQKADIIVNANGSTLDGLTLQYRLSGEGIDSPIFQDGNVFPNIALAGYTYTVDVRYVVTGSNPLVVVKGSSVSSTIDVVESADTTNPVFADNLNDITIATDANKCTAIVTYNNPVVTDNCAFVGDITGYTFAGKFNGHSYYVSNTALNPINANKAAFNIGGHLVTIEDDFENDFLRDNAILKANVYEGFWIGLNDTLVQRDFKWVTGGTPSSYKWNGSQPSDNSGTEDWVEFYVNWGGDKIGNHTENGKWNDNSVTNIKKYVIEFEGPRFTQTAGLTSGSAFPVGTTTNTFEIINSDGSGTGIFKSFDVTVSKENNLALLDVTGTTTPETDAGITGGEHCPDLNGLQAVIAPSGYTYSPGTSRVQFRVDRLCDSGDWSFSYTIGGAEVVVNKVLISGVGTSTNSSGVVNVNSGTAYVLFTIDVDNVVGTLLPIDFAISTGGTNSAIKDAITIQHKLKIIPQIGGFE